MCRKCRISPSVRTPIRQYGSNVEVLPAAASNRCRGRTDCPSLPQKHGVREPVTACPKRMLANPRYDRPWRDEPRASASSCTSALRLQGFEPQLLPRHITSSTSTKPNANKLVVHLDLDVDLVVLLPIIAQRRGQTRGGRRTYALGLRELHPRFLEAGRDNPDERPQVLDDPFIRCRLLSRQVINEDCGSHHRTHLPCPVDDPDHA